MLIDCMPHSQGYLYWARDPKVPAHVSVPQPLWVFPGSMPGWIEQQTRSCLVLPNRGQTPHGVVGQGHRAVEVVEKPQPHQENYAKKNSLEILNFPLHMPHTDENLLAQIEISTW